MKDFSDRTVDSLEASEILSIPNYWPERLFKPDEAEVKKRYREFATKWHPDTCKAPNAADVFQRITELKDAALDKLGKGTWEVLGEVKFINIDPKGKDTKFKYVKKHSFELGEMYISQDQVVYAVRKEFEDLFQNAVNVIRGLKYPNRDIEAKLTGFTPEIDRVIETKDNLVMFVKKDPRLVLLSDLQESLGGKIEPKPVGWIVNRLYYMARFLEFNGLAHNGISENTVFVLPEEHKAALLGGWWYAVKDRQPLIGLPPYTVNAVPSSLLDSTLADKRVDLTLIHKVGCRILGEKKGVLLTLDKDIPKSMASFLTLPPQADVDKDSEVWKKVLKDNFGPPAWVEMVNARNEAINFNSVYK